MRNLTFKAAMLNDSRTTVNRQSTDGQSQRHYKQTPLSKRWKVLMTLVFLFTFAIGNVWAAAGDATTSNAPKSGGTSKDYANTISVAAGYLDGNVMYYISNNLTFISTDGLEANYLGFVFKPSVDLTIDFEGFNGNSGDVNITYQIDSIADAAFYEVFTEAGSNKISEKIISDNGGESASSTHTVLNYWKDNGVVKYGSKKWQSNGDNAPKNLAGQQNTTYFGNTRLVTNKVVAISSTKSAAAGTYSFMRDATNKFVFKAGKVYRIYSTRGSSKTGYKSFTFTPVYQLTWALDGGSITSAADAYTNAGYYAKGTELTAPTVTKAGADFAGWSPALAATMPAAATTYTATWATACSAGVPGNVTKGALTAGEITLTAEGSAASGDTWYWQTSESGVDKTNAGSSFVATAAGTYYVRSYNTAADCWNVTAKSIELTAEDFLATPTVTFDDGAYVVGASALNLSTLFESQNTSAVSFALKVASEDATVSGSNFTATKAGSYVVVATQAADATYKAVSEEATIVVTYPAIGDAVVTYNLDVTNNGTTLQTLATTNATSSSISVSASTDLLAGGLTKSSSKGTHNGTRTLGINTLAEETADKYFNVTFSVADGKMFTPTAISLKVLTIGGNATSYKAVLTDGVNSIIGTVDATNDSEKTLGNWIGLGTTTLTGDVTLKLYAWYTTSGSYNAYRLSTPITIAGTVAAIPSSSAPVISAPDADQAAVYDLNDVIAPLEITASGYPTPTYQWYSNSSASTTGATAIEGAQSASYTPANNVASDLYYYCVATNASGSATSHYFHVAVKAPSVPTIYTETTAMTLTSNKVATDSKKFTFSGANLGETAVTLVLASAVDGLTLSTSSVTPTAGSIADTEVTVSYKSVVDVAEAHVNLYLKQGEDVLHTIDLTYSSTAGIEDLTSISAATTWNWDGAANAAFGTLDQNAMIVLANADVTWDAGFNALAIAGKLQHYYRDSKYAQGHELKFNTTVPGRVTVTFSNTSTKTTARAPRITDVNGSYAPTAEADGAKTADSKTYAHNVAAGDVLIAGFEMIDGTPANMLRFYKVEFVPTYTVAYAANGGSGDMTDANAYVAGDEVTLLPNTFAPESGYVWSAWSVKDKDNNDIPVTSGKFTMPASNVTVTAQWVVDNGMARLYRSDDTEDDNSPYATLVEAVAAAQDGDKIVLQRNVADGAGIMLTKDDHKTLTIDFGGYTYTAVSPGVGSAGTQNQAFHLEKGNTVTLMNGTITSSGSTIKMLIQNYCDLTLENITLDGTGLEGSHRYVMSNNCGDVVIGDGTTITAKAGDVAFDVCATNYYPEGVKVTVEAGATVNGIVEYDVWGSKPADNKAELAIEGGTLNITWNVESALAEDAKSNLNVSGGAFAAVVPLDYCAEGFIPVTEADPGTGKYAVTPGYKVTFIDGSEELEKVAVAEGSAVAEKELAGKMGYDFDAWYTENTFENAWDFATVVPADMSLYAKWTAFEGCTELWPATSGDAPTAANQEITLQTGSNGGHIYTVSAKNDKFNESFEYTENGFALKKGGDDVIRVEMANDIVAGTKISVTLKSGDTGARGLNLLTATGAKVKGGTKLGWDDATVGAVETFSYTVEAGDGLEGTNIFRLQRNNSVYLQCVRVESCGAAIVYHNLTSAVNIAGKGTVTLGATSVREGYTTTAEYSAIDPLYEFVNWTVSGAGASVENATANPATITVGTEDAVVTLNLQLIPVKFTVNYYDGTTAMGTELVPVNEHPTASEINTNKRHYTFQGWSETDGGSVVALNTITRTEATTVNLYAKYEPVACPTSGYLFSLESDEAKRPAEKVKAAKNGGEVDLADYATISGGAARIINDETGSDKDAVGTDGKFLLTATKEVMKIELNCVLQEGDIIRIPDNNQKYVLSTTNAKSGTYQAQTSSQHEFAVTADWAGVDDIYVLYDGSSLNFTKVYVYRPALFTVSFNLKGHGSAVADIENVLEGSKITAPAAPTDEDFAFAGWYKENTLENEWDFDNDVVSANTTLFAKWLDKSDATLKSLKYGTTDIELEDGVYEYEIALAAATASVPALTAVTNNPAANAAITNAAAFDGEGKATSTVEVTPQKEGAAHLTYTVKFSKLAALPQVNVTGSTTWNFSAGGSTSLTNQSDVVLANLPGINNDANFNSQALLGSFNKLEGTYFQGSKLSFTTEVAGKLTITFRGTNDHARHLQVCVGDGETVVADWNYNNSSTSQTKTIFVPEGKVTLKAFEGDVAQNARIYNMIFNATPDYTRPVTEGRYGTICLPNGGVMTGATLYEVAYYGQTSKKIFFDEILNGEMVAGVPYIFLPKEGASQLAVYYTDEANESAKNANGLHGFIGDDADDEMNVPVGAYILNANQYREVVTLGTAKIKSNRSYIVLEDINPSEPALAPGRRRISMSVYSEQVATGIENTGFESEAPRKVLINGELYIIRGEKMYDAKGQLVK